MRKNRKSPGPPKGHALSPKEQPVPVVRRQVLVVALGLAAIALVMSPLFIVNRPEKVAGRGLSEVLSAVDRGTVDGQPIHWIEVDDDSRMVILHMVDGSKLGAHYPDYYGATLVGRLEATGLLFETDPPDSPSLWGPTVDDLPPGGADHRIPVLVRPEVRHGRRPRPSPRPRPRRATCPAPASAISSAATRPSRS